MQPHLSGKRLSDLCHRLAISSESGIDIRRIWQREADSARGSLKSRFAQVRDDVGRGDSLTLALARTGKLFPRLFLELVDVGEQTGTTAEVFHRLASHYEQRHRLERNFLSQIAWPMIQLAAAVGVIGLLILIMGMLPKAGGKQTDILGWGLIGMPGFIIYASALAVIGGVVAAIIYAIRRGRAWTRPLQHAIIRLPGVGPCIEKLCLARLAWALHLTLNVEMDLRRLVPLALRATGNDYYIRHTDQIVADVGTGQPLHDAFARSGAFPVQFLDPLAVAEESGQIVESMARLSRQYEEEAESATKTLAVLAGFAVWAIVAAIIIAMIFKLFGFYVGAINEAAAPL
ncbi:MAG: type II secretion system F family protein [Pirellulales bacterium]